MFDILGLAAVFLFIFYLWKSQKKPLNYPPGPQKWPLIGSFTLSPFASQKGDHRKKVANMVEEYGPTIGTYLGTNPIVYLHDPVFIRKVFNMEVFSGRVNNTEVSKVRSPNGRPIAYGILTTDGQTWHGQRRFSLKTLKDLGFGRTSSDLIIQEEASLLIDHLIEKSGNGDFHFKNTMNIPVINVLWRMIASKRFEMDDAKAEEIMMALTQTVGNPRSPFQRLLRLMPGASKLMRKSENFKRFILLVENLFSMFRQSIKEHKETLDRSAPRDFIDYYLMEIENTKDDDFSEDQLMGIIFDLFIAGAETTSTTLKWAVLFLTLNPDVQQKCRQEIEDMIGSRQPALPDMDKLVYCQATILEVQRMGCTVPSSLNHRVMEDTLVDGHFFPKDTIVLANIYYMMKSEAFWENPSVFDPNRFIKAGKLQKDLPQMMPFSVGRRVCMGDSLAKNELSIFFTSMVQRLKFSVPLQGKKPSPDEFHTGATSIPEDYSVHIEQC